MNDCCPTPETTVTPPQAPVSWCAGNKTLTYANGRITESARVPPIPDGVYPNATVTVVDGCTTSIVAGTNVVYSACDPCVTPPTPPPPSGTVPIDGSACNLSSFSPSDGLLTTLITQNSSCITMSGCGNASSPLIALPRISTDAGNTLQCRPSGLFVPNALATPGVNYTGCGITIANGVWTGIPLPFFPIMQLTSTDGSVLFSNSGCVWDLSAVAQPTVSVVNQALSFNAVGDLPPSPGGGNGWAIVGAANPRSVYMFINGIGWRQLLDSTSAGCRITV